MKARVKATGKIVCIERNIDNCRGGYVASDGKIYNACDLELIVDNDPDYWTRLEHQYAGMAMQGLMSYVAQITPKKGRSFCDEIVDISFTVAHALVEKYKKEER